MLEVFYFDEIGWRFQSHYLTKIKRPTAFIRRPLSHPENRIVYINSTGYLISHYQFFHDM